MQIQTTDPSFTMSSLDFLNQVINPIRANEGESALRNTELVRKLQDELDVELADFLQSQPSKGQKSQKYLNLNYDQMMLVGMRESKSVRKAVLAKLKELEAQVAVPKPELPDFTNPAEAARAWALEYEQKQIAEQKLLEAAPKVAFVDNLVDRTNLMNATQVGQKHGLSARKLNQFLEQLDVYSKAVKRGRTFKQWFIDKGYGELKQTEQGYPQALFTTTGEIWINEQLINEGVV